MKISQIINNPELKSDILEKLTSTKIPMYLQKNSTEIFEFLSNATSEDKVPQNLRADIEAIILLVGRPVLEIQNNTFSISVSSEWHEKLTNNREKIEKAIPAVGRIEVREHPSHEWLGTGWLISENIIVTNRHVASEFAMKKNNDFVFRHNVVTEKKMIARIDFREELGSPDQIEFNIEKVLYIDEGEGPDIAFLQISSISNSSTNLPEPIKLSPQKIEIGKDVAIIGYPARDPLRNNPQDMDRIFNSIYNVKRLAPGSIISLNGNSDWIIAHDCSTLGGNSGSVLIDIESGEAVGLHFAGKYRDSNYAVSSTKISELLNNIL